MSQGRKHSILLVDDELDALETIQMLLEDDFQVMTAAGGGAALALLESESVEMVIADQRMPGMTGVELLARVRETQPEVVRLILTAYTDFEAMLRAINEGRVYRYIIKPWDPDDMLVTIRQALEWRELVLTTGKLSAEVSEAHRALLARTRELERAQQTIIKQEKLAAVGRFASEMTHEINNHLQVIMGVSSVGDAYEEQEKNRIIESQARMLHCITEDIRDFALGARMPFTPRSVDPVDVVADVIRTCTHHPAFRNVQIRFEHGQTEHFTMDVRQFKHLVFNLLKNAAHASPRGATVDVDLDVEDDLRLSVSDGGPGVPDEIRERIWEPFFTTSSQNGTGLGLSICKRVADLHGGELELLPSPQGGARFVLRLPRDRPTRT